MSRLDPQSTKTAPLLHLFNRDRASTVAFEDDVLTVWDKSGRIAHTVRADEIGKPKYPSPPGRLELDSSNPAALAMLSRLDRYHQEGRHWRRCHISASQ